MAHTSNQRGMVAFWEAWYGGCSISDCNQAFSLAYDGIEMSKHTSNQRGMVAGQELSLFPAMDRAYKVLSEAYRNGCSPYDCHQAFWLAYDGIEPAPADEDYAPVHHDTNDVY